MSGVDFSIDAGQLLGFSIGSLSADTEGEVGTVLREVGDLVEAFIFGGAWPVLTGRSLRAWRVFVEGTTLVVQNPVEYVSFINGGTYTTMGESAAAVRDAVNNFWQARSGEVAEIVERGSRQQRLFREPAGTRLGDFTRAAVQRQLMQAAGVSSPLAGTLFQSLSSAFSIQRIRERERRR